MGVIHKMEDDDETRDDFSIATHFVKVRRTGALSDVTTLWELVGTEAVSGSLDSILDRPGFDRLPSINAFDKVGVVKLICKLTLCLILIFAVLNDTYL